MATLPVENNPPENRFEVNVDGETAVLLYEQSDNQLTILETLVPPAIEGRGVGSALAKAGLDYAVENNLRVMVICPFVKAYVQRHPEYLDIVK